MQSNDEHCTYLIICLFTVMAFMKLFTYELFIYLHLYKLGSALKVHTPICGYWLSIEVAINM